MPVIFLRDIASGLDQLAPARQVVDGQQRIRTYWALSRLSFYRILTSGTTSQFDDPITLRLPASDLMSFQKVSGIESLTMSLVLIYFALIPTIVRFFRSLLE